MRQAGILAKAAWFALVHHRVRLADDHARARALAVALGNEAHVAPVETNIVIVRVKDANDVETRARAAGVLVSVMGEEVIRLVTHLDIDDTAIAQAIAVLKRLG